MLWDRSLRWQLGMLWVRPWKDLPGLNRGWPKCFPEGGIPGKKGKLRTIHYRQWQWLNRWLHAGNLTKTTLF
jgi:hypothetical protein